MKSILKGLATLSLLASAHTAHAQEWNSPQERSPSAVNVIQATGLSSDEVLHEGDIFRAQVTVVQGRETGLQLKLDRPRDFFLQSDFPVIWPVELLDLGEGWTGHTLAAGQRLYVQLVVRAATPSFHTENGIVGLEGTVIVDPATP